MKNIAIAVDLSTMSTPDLERLANAIPRTPNRYVKHSGVVRQKGTNRPMWAVSINDRIVEGGFFSRDAAVAACLWWEVNYREEGSNA